MKNKILSLIVFISLITFSIAFAEEQTVAVSNVVSSGDYIDASIQGVTADYYPCMSAVASAKEDALITGWNAYASATLSAYTARKTEIIAAWTLADRNAVQKAANEANKKFNQLSVEIQKEWKTVQTNALKKYQTGRVECLKSYGSSSASSTSQSTTNLQNMTKEELIKMIEVLLQKKQLNSSTNIKANPSITNKNSTGNTLVP